MKKNLVWIILSSLIIIADRLSKCAAVTHLRLHVSHRIFPFLNFRLSHNRGVAFSLWASAPEWQIALLSLMAIAVSIIVIVWLVRLPARQYTMQIALSFILGGALGNLWDRVSRGYVIDFIDFHIHGWHFATFNVADAAITVGACMIALSLLVQSSHER